MIGGTSENDMSQPKILFVGGLVAMGFDATGQFLLTVTHSGRGLFSVGSWQRVARDTNRAYPENGKAMGIGPIQGQTIPVAERDENGGQMNLVSPDGKFHLLGESDGITITEMSREPQPDPHR